MQSLLDFEHIVIDGASRDGSVEYLESVSDHRLAFISEPDGGIYEAMNKGIRESTGRHLMFINSGDSLSAPDSLHIVAQHFEAKGCAWAYGGLRLTDLSGSPTGAYVFDPFRKHKFVMGLNWIPHAAACLTREFIDRIGMYRTDFGTMADQEFFMRAVAAELPSVITWFISDYELGGISQTTSPREREYAWRRMRAEAGLLWHGRVADRLITEILATRKPARILMRRMGEA
jgi:glycosyltransferase involved in cell wall biosynthesis